MFFEEDLEKQIEDMKRMEALEQREQEHFKRRKRLMSEKKQRANKRKTKKYSY